MKSQGTTSLPLPTITHLRDLLIHDTMLQQVVMDKRSYHYNDDDVLSTPTSLRLSMNLVDKRIPLIGLSLWWATLSHVSRNLGVVRSERLWSEQEGYRGEQKQALSSAEAGQLRRPGPSRADANATSHLHSSAFCKSRLVESLYDISSRPHCAPCHHCYTSSAFKQRVVTSQVEWIVTFCPSRDTYVRPCSSVT